MRLKDTPRRYIYREIAGLSAVMALQIIKALRKCYPTLRDELEVERLYFIAALRKQNSHE